MPSVTVHMHLAQQVLDHWDRAPRQAPLPVDNPAAVMAFRLGAMGPDMGYLPGGFEPLSDLAHTVGAGTLTRNLLDQAQTPVEEAFAWGWVTHVLADILIHPLVGCAVGELVHGSPGCFVDGDTDAVNHVRVEVGLDALVAQRHPGLKRLALSPVFHQPTDVAFLHAAYLRSYDAAPEPEVILASHRNAVRRIQQGLGLVGLSAVGLPEHPGSGPRGRSALRRVRSFVGRQSVSLAFLLPAPPPLWLMNAVRDVEEQFAEIFLEEMALGGHGIPDVNLDTGRPDLEEVDYGGLRRSLAFLEARGGRPPNPAMLRAGRVA